MLIDEPTFELLKKSIQKEGWLELPAYGNSMFPFIRAGNLCRFVCIGPEGLKKGDVILYYSKANQLIAHRLVEMRRTTDQMVYLLKGDTNLGMDEPIDEERILGKLKSVQKRYIKIMTDHVAARLFGKAILSFPILSGMLRLLLNRKYKLQL